jgi:hypothetical protein
MGLPTWFAKTRPWSFHPAAFPFLGLALAMEPEGFHGLRSQLHRAAALVPLWRIEGAVGIEGTLHRELASVKVDGEHVQSLKTVSSGCCKQCSYLSGGEQLGLVAVGQSEPPPALGRLTMSTVEEGGAERRTSEPYWRR